jgi:hypothetical protein
MRFGSALRRALMAGLLALLAFAPGVSLPGTAKLGLGGPAKAQDVFAIDQFYDALAPMASGSTTRHTAMRGCGFPCRRIGAPSRSGTGSIPTNTAGTGIRQSLSPGPCITMADGNSIRPTGGTGAGRYVGAGLSAVALRHGLCGLGASPPLGVGLCEARGGSPPRWQASGAAGSMTCRPFPFG